MLPVPVLSLTVEKKNCKCNSLPVLAQTSFYSISLSQVRYIKNSYRYQFNRTEKWNCGRHKPETMQLITGMPTVLVLFRLSTGSFVAYWIDLLLPKTIKLVDTASLLEVQSLKGQCEAVSASENFPTKNSLIYAIR